MSPTAAFISLPGSIRADSRSFTSCGSSASGRGSPRGELPTDLGGGFRPPGVERSRPARSARGHRPCRELAGHALRVEDVKPELLPSEANMIGCRSARTLSAAPPRASPSSLVSTTPVKPTPSRKASAVTTASKPIMASGRRRSRRLDGVAFRAWAISSSSIPRRPAVSTIDVVHLRAGGRVRAGPPTRAPRRPRPVAPPTECRVRCEPGHRPVRRRSAAGRRRDAGSAGTSRACGPVP